MNEVTRWWSSLKIIQYAQRFEAEGYDDMEDIHSLSLEEIAEMIARIGIKSRHADKIPKNLQCSGEKLTKEIIIYNGADFVHLTEPCRIWWYQHTWLIGWPHHFKSNNYATAKVNEKFSV